MLLSCQNISVSFGEKIILDKVSFDVEENEKCAVVGINGAGKTTLLNVIAGTFTDYAGVVAFSGGKTMSYLTQLTGDRDVSVYDEILSARPEISALEEKMKQQLKDIDRSETPLPLIHAYDKTRLEYEERGGYAYKGEVDAAFFGLGFSADDRNRPFSTLSGGERTRASLGKILLGKPDLLILDEPTNHLDLNALKWLENFILQYKKAMLIVSHDRYFLDKTMSKIIEIEFAKGYVYHGNYSAFIEKKAAKRKAAFNAYKNQQKDLKHQEAIVAQLRSFNREKTVRRADSRQKMLDKIELLERPDEASNNMFFALTPDIVSGNDVLTARGLRKQFEGVELFADLSLEIKRGEHVAIIGENGTGKTTLLKLLTGALNYDEQEKPEDDFTEDFIEDESGVILGSKVIMAYYDQEHQNLGEQNTLYDEIANSYPHMTTTRIRNTLAAFGFTGDEVTRCVGVLSGGERGRLSLAKLVLSKANFLVLDEPTNHLDILSKEILEDALNAYEGTLLYVSHDRYFINATAHKILELENKTLTMYPGNFDYYENKKAELFQINTDAILPDVHKMLNAVNKVKSVTDDTKEGKISAGEDYLERKQARSTEKKRLMQIKKSEDRIETLENELAALDQLMRNEEIASDAIKLMEICEKQAKMNEELEREMERWEQLFQES